MNINENKEPIVIFGSSEIARLAKYYFDNDSKYKVVCFTVDDQYVSQETIDGIPIVKFSDLKVKFSPKNYRMHVALSYQKLNKLRQDKYFQAKNAGYELVSYVSSNLLNFSDQIIGDNCFILENQTIQPSVKIGNNVVIWSGNHLGHSSEIGDHTYISSHVVISGNCKIGKRCFLGVNASLKDFCEISNDCFITMGANVTNNMPEGSIAMPQKTEIYLKNDRRNILIKKKYFNI